MFLTVILDNVHKKNVEMLYKRYYRLMYSIALKILLDKQLAEDAVTETSLRILKNKKYIENKSESHTRNYIGRTCSNVAKEIMRKKEFSCEYIEDLYDESQPESNPEYIVIKNENRADLTEILAKLKPEYRDVLILRFVYGMSVKAIADSFGLKAETVRKRIQRGKVLFAEELKKEDAAYERTKEEGR